MLLVCASERLSSTVFHLVFALQNTGGLIVLCVALQALVLAFGFKSRLRIPKGFCIRAFELASNGRLIGLLQTWLILPVVICLSQRLSHACLSISFYTAKLRMAH